MQKIILFGAGGHAKVVIDAILKQKLYKITGIIDVKDNLGIKILGIPVAGCDNDLSYFYKKGIKNCFVAIGSVGKSDLRVRLFNLAKRTGFRFPNIIHSGACVSEFAKLGEGNYIACGAVINAGALIGDNCIVNTGAIIEHNCVLGNFVHLASGAALSGGVSIGDYAHIGTGASVIHLVKIGSNTIVGAGSVVLKDLEGGVVAYGNPAKIARKNA